MNFEKLAERYKEQRDLLLVLIDTAPVTSGVCCCGDDMKNHPDPMSCGHTPVDQWDHTTMRIAQDMAKFDNDLKEQN